MFKTTARSENESVRCQYPANMIYRTRHCCRLQLWLILMHRINLSSSPWQMLLGIRKIILFSSLKAYMALVQKGHRRIEVKKRPNCWSLLGVASKHCFYSFNSRNISQQVLPCASTSIGNSQDNRSKINIMQYRQLWKN